MNYIKKYFLVVFTLILSLLPANAINETKTIDAFSRIVNIQELIQKTTDFQSYIIKYSKNHSKEQNLELLLALENNLDKVSENNRVLSSTLNNYPNDEYIKNLQSQFSKTIILPSYEYKTKEYKFSTNYTKEYNLFGKFIPDDWALYLKYLSIEQTDKYNGDLDRNETNLAMWETFVVKYPNFEKNWIIYNKIKQYENAYFRGDVFINKYDNRNVYKEDVIKAYDKFSQKYPNSRYGIICTRLSNLKKLKHDFVSPYDNNINNIENAKNKYGQLQNDKQFVLDNAKYVFDINTNIWHQFSKEYIRGNYIFVVEHNNDYKLYNKEYKENATLALPEGYNFKNLFVKNNKLFAYSRDYLKFLEMKFDNSNKALSFSPVNKLALAELYKNTNIIYLSNLAKKDENEFQISVKNKKYPKRYMIYNDTEDNYYNYSFGDNSNVKYINNIEFEVTNKTSLEFTLQTRNNEDDTISAKYIFNFK